jgi:phage minor structural protein
MLLLTVYDYQGNKLILLKVEDSSINGEAFDIKLTQDIYDIDVLEFTIPAYIHVDGTKTIHPALDYLSNEYKVRFEYGDYDDYFYIKRPVKTHNNNELCYKVECLHVTSILNQKGIAKTIDITDDAEAIMTEVLEDSGWSIGTIDAFTGKTRRYEKSDSSVMEMLADVAELFEGILSFDGVNQEVSLQETIGDNNGVTFRYDINMTEVTRTDNSNELVTRLYVEGGTVGDTITTIASVNPTGEVYIDDTSYFDDFLSSAQIAARTQYDIDITSVNGDIDTDTSNITNTTGLKTTAETNIQLKTLERAVKQQEKNEIDDQIQIEKDATTKANLQAQSASLASDISDLDSDISDLNSDVSGYDADLVTYNANLVSHTSSKDSTISTYKSTMKEFIREGIYKNDSYVSAQDLYDDALEILEKVSIPKVEYDMKILDLSGLTGYELLSFKLGDVIGIVDEELQIGTTTPLPAKITTITKHIDNPDNNTVTIANFRGEFDDEWNRIVRNTEVVKKRREYYERAYLGLDGDGVPKGDILQQSFDANKYEIINGTNNTVTYDEYGITVVDNDDSDKYVRINAGVISITADGGSTWKVGMSADGISALNITSGVLDTKVIQVWNTDEPKFFWDRNGLFAFGDNDDEWIRFNAEGIYGTTQVGIDKNSTTESEFNLVLNWDKLQHTRSDLKLRTTISVTDGIKIEKGDGIGGWTDKFYADVDGNLFLDGSITATTGVIGGWTISSTAIYKDSGVDATSSGMASADYPFYAGKQYASRATAPFRVTDAGVLVATSATISGSITITGGSGIANLTDAGDLAIADTADFATQVSGAQKPSNNATVGADWTSNLLNIPGTLGTPSGSGLFLSSTHLGYYDSGTWKTYMDNSGNFYLGGTGGKLQWNAGTNTLTVNGTMTSGSITSTSTINVTTDLTVGNDIYIGSQSSSDLKRVLFNNGARISGEYIGANPYLYISAQTVEIDNGNVKIGNGAYTITCGATWNFSSATINNFSYYTAGTGINTISSSVISLNTTYTDGRYAFYNTVQTCIGAGTGGSKTIDYINATGTGLVVWFTDTTNETILYD